MFQAQANSKQEEGISTKLHVNTLLLASQSSYFKALFTNGMRESHDNKTTFFVSDEEEKEAFIDVIRYLYDGEFKSHSPVHLLKVLILADEYSVLSVVEASVAKILEDTYSIETYCMFLEIPESLRHSESFAPLLKTASHELVKKFLQFDHLWQSDEFLQLTSKGLATILQSDELNVATENTIYQAVLKWINRPPHVQNRRVYLRELMPLVRFPMMSAHFLHDVVSRFVTKEPYFLPMYIEALKYHAIGSERVDIERSLGTINCSPQFRLLLIWGESENTRKKNGPSSLLLRYNKRKTNHNIITLIGTLHIYSHIIRATYFLRSCIEDIFGRTHILPK